MGLLGTMSAIGTASSAIAGRHSDRRPRMAGDLSRQRSARCSGVPSRISYLCPDAKGPEDGSSPLRHDGTLLLALTLGACARHDDRARQFWVRSTSLCSWLPCRYRSLRIRREASRITLSTGNVPRPGRMRKPHHQHARCDGDDGDPGGRPIDHFPPPSCSTQLMSNSSCRSAPIILRPERCPGRPYRRALRRAPHDHHWTH